MLGSRVAIQWCASTTDHWKVEVIQLVRITMEQIVVYKYHGSWRRVEVILRNTVGQIVVYQHLQIMEFIVEVIQLVRSTVEQIVASQCHRS